MPESSSSRRASLFHKAESRQSRFPFSVIILAIAVVLFGLIRPSRAPTDINPGSVSPPPPTAGPTARPRPTDIHGGHIVFTCTRGDVNQICMINADGSGYQQLTTGSTNSYYPAISRDGEHIIFAVNQYDTFDLYRLSPGVVEGSRSGTSRLKRLTDYIGNSFSPSFSPDGRQVVFVNRVEGRPTALWLMDSDGQEPHPIYSPPNDLVGAAWSPDGRYIAFTMAVERSYAYEVFLLDLHNLSLAPRKVQSELADIGGSISWSPDQADLLLFAGPAAAREIYRLNLGSGSVTQLTFGGNNASPAYSPDGEYIVFNSLRNNGQADLYIMHTDGHSMRQLTDHPEPDWQPQWGP